MESISEEEGEKKKSVFGRVISFVIVVIVLGLLVIYFILPSNTLNFNFGNDTNTNFSLNNNTGDMQFYTNMRFPDKSISYSIDNDCTLQKKNEMEWAFKIVGNDTVLKFYESNPAQIRVSCDDKNKLDSNGLFIAGEGGPTNISLGKDFRVIQGGQVLLIRNSNCERPNIAIHELLHVLGFNHSSNSNNIMYPISKCKQTIGEDTIGKINELYSIPSLPDLQFEKVTANIKSRFLDITMLIRNEGLKESGPFKAIIYSGDKKIKEVDLDALPIGNGHSVTIENLIVPTIKIDTIKIKLENNFQELDKKNNEIILNVSK